MRQMITKLLFLIGAIFLSPGITEAQIKAVIFDCDGVLVDTEGLKFSAWKLVFASQEIQLQPEDYAPFVGHTGESILESLCKKKKIPPSPLMLTAKEVVYRKLQEQGVSSFPQMILFVKALNERREEGEIAIGLASSAPKEEIANNLDQVGITTCFDLVLSGKDDLFGYHDPEGTNKPKPYIYEEAAKQLGVAPEECLVFEDTEAGVLAAHLAGCYVAAVPNPWTTSQDFSLANITFHNAKADELIDWLEEMLKLD